MVSWQMTIDANQPTRLVAFWATALGYVVQPPPAGFDTWNDWYLSVGVPSDEVDQEGDGADRIMDPSGDGPTIWFQAVPESKSGKNRLHLDIRVGGGRGVALPERRRRVDTRVAELVEAGASVLRTMPDDVDGVTADQDWYFVVMQDPEGNEFCVV